jgi:CRP-like cAMP-binding protein
MPRSDSRTPWWRPARRRDPKVVELAGLELFGTCRPRDLRVLASVTDAVTFAAGEALCREGRRPYECFVIAAGTVEVRVHDQPVAVLGRGDVVGETAVLDGGVRTATVVAVTDVQTFAIDRRRLDDLLERAPAIARAMLKQLAVRLRQVDSELVAGRGEGVAS